MEVISLIMAFIFGEAIMLLVLCIIAMAKDKKPKNKVHFYVARDKSDELFLYIGKPYIGINQFHPCQNGCMITSGDDLSNFGLNKDDYADLKWEDEPVEVFINMED